MLLCLKAAKPVVRSAKHLSGLPTIRPHLAAPAPAFSRRQLLATFTTSTGVLAAAPHVAMASLQSARIIPDILDKVAGQQVNLHVAFGPTLAKDGVLIAPAKASHVPEVKIGGDPGALYTLICSDLDPPDPANPVMKEWLHWLVTNIKDNSVASGDELASYRGPSPPIGTHRYVFMLFKQPGPIKASDPTHGKRGHFNTRDFAAKHSLGNPVAVEYFNSHK